MVALCFKTLAFPTLGFLTRDVRTHEANSFEFVYILLDSLDEVVYTLLDSLVDVVDVVDAMFSWDADTAPQLKSNGTSRANNTSFFIIFFP